ncbi:hypothetical protein SSX86_026555 [Deinandra increscens subsp. villosa]|uniref:Uncharacterized protein n=1 Tax=Deinandra increscens subsp. villosa TaxID=3103831 RepID=A0AAP0CJT9_9ASTR
MFSASDASRNSGWMKNQPALPQIQFQEEIDSTSDNPHMKYDKTTTRRSNLEYMDYDGTGANDRHDPKSPGRA